MNRFGITALAACGALALTVAFAGSASAVIVSTNTVLPSPITDPNDTLDPTSTTGLVFLDVTGNDLAPPPNRRSPFDGTAFVDTALYHSVQAASTATYDFGSDRTLFSLMWGSPDRYNTLEFFLNGLSVLALMGDDVAPPPTLGTGFVNVSISDIIFDRVVFSSRLDAFEFTNVSAIPLPASLLLLMSAIGGLGFVSRRKAAFASA